MSKQGPRDWYEKRLWFLEEYRTIVFPLMTHALAAERYGVDFSLMAIRTGALLNGGALVALPAFGAFFQISAPESLNGIFWAGSAFVFGLLLSWLAMAAAYLTNNFHSRMVFAARDLAQNSADLSLARALGHEAEPVPDKRDEHQEEMKAERKRTIGWHIVAMALWSLSLVAFVAGAYLGGLALVEGAPAARPT